ncbi:MAG TPA: 3-isopropylmalate dehydratase small subunit [Gemmatimonadaceae bacterium]|jgi:3-isopropylmalate/(R)-2-methylmalate dehydratase small subunit|nr:3-isopropylmalate dehydratase small subunit [Gemmatimonadaceae bacterium]
MTTSIPPFTIQPFNTLTSRCVVLQVSNVDTDQIIPARFLKTIERRGLGAHLFADWRLDEHGRPRAAFPLNAPTVAGAAILVAGDNFGCGSSREHAPWALLDFGFRAVISTGFADIFRNNALKTGLLPVTLTPPAHASLLQLLAESPGAEVTIDLAAQLVRLPSGEIQHFPLDPFARHCLLDGVDELGFLLAQENAIATYETAHPARVCTN